VAAVVARTGQPAHNAFTQLAATLTGTAFRTAMIRRATVGQARSFAELVEEAFALLSGGLAEPWPAANQA
jgi:hypothetical protein